MKFFDLHADIFYDLTVQEIKGTPSTFEERHLKKFKAGNVKSGIFVVWYETDSEIAPSVFVNRAFDVIESLEENAESSLYFIKDFKTLEDSWNTDKVGVIIGMEGVSAFGDSMEPLEAYYESGLRHIGLTWNEQNAFATGVFGEPTRGITPLGRKLIERAQSKNMLVDLAHLNEKSFWDAMSFTTKPLFVSHANAFKLCPHSRNLKDEQIKEIARNGGVIGLASVGSFLSEDMSERHVDKFIDHLMHMAYLGGIESVAVGFDFCDYIYDEYVGVKNLEDASKTGFLVEGLIKRGFSKNDIEKIAYQNVLRYIKSTGF